MYLLNCESYKINGEPFRHFFWLQEVDESKDSIFVEAIRKYLNDPTAAAPSQIKEPESDYMARIMSALSQNQGC